MKGIVGLLFITKLVQCGLIQPWDPLGDYEEEWEHEKNYKRGEGPNKDLDSNGKYVGDFNSECSESTVITKSKKSAEVSADDDILKMDNVKCHWNVIGTDECTPNLECKKFKLAPNTGKTATDKCKEEYIEVTDGVGGYEKFCGEDPPKNITATLKLRDLYITYKANSKKDKRHLKCSISCAVAGSGKELPKSFSQITNAACRCGRKPNGDRIVGGEDAKRGEFPWIAGLVTSKTRKPFCGGTVINDKFILTAAHCFKGPYVKKDNLEVVLGGHLMDLTSSKVASGQGGDSGGDDFPKVQAEDKKQNSIRFAVDKYYIHPLYVKQTNDYDIALIKLKDKINFKANPQVVPVCMPDVATYKVDHVGKMATVAGWGLNSSDATVTMGTLQKLNVKVFPYEECKTFFTDRFTQRMMCAGQKEAGKDSCKGDSGGPLIAEKTTQIWEIIGAVSWGESCAGKNSPGVYLKINEVSQWIRYTANNEEAAWCSEK